MSPLSRQAADIFAHIHERVDEAYERVLGLPGAPGFGPEKIEPPADVYETADAVVVQIDVPGVRHDVEIEVDGRQFTFRGERPPLKGTAERTYSRVEIVHGALERQLELPAIVTVDGANATYADGVLEIVLPKCDESVRRHLLLRLTP